MEYLYNDGIILISGSPDVAFSGTIPIILNQRDRKLTFGNDFHSE